MHRKLGLLRQVPCHLNVLRVPPPLPDPLSHGYKVGILLERLLQEPRKKCTAKKQQKCGEEKERGRANMSSESKTKHLERTSVVSFY